MCACVLTVCVSILAFNQINDIYTHTVVPIGLDIERHRDIDIHLLVRSCVCARYSSIQNSEYVQGVLYVL